MDVTASTPKVLDRCLRLFDKPGAAQETQSKPSTPAPYASHPDIQFFSSVKSKHHFAYHRSKVKQLKTVRKLESKTLPFNPFSRSQLLQRLGTYSPLNWDIPYTSEDILTELACARAGWVNSRSGVNHLHCSICELHTILRFNDIVSQPKYSVVRLGLADIVALNHQLKKLYLDKLRLLAHKNNCPWRNLQCPTKVYYLPPYLASTNEVLLKTYVAALKAALDDLEGLNLFSLALLAAALLYSLPNIVPISQQWLLATYFNDSKENIELLFDTNLPTSVYSISALGWTLKVMRFGVKTLLVLKCHSCFQKHSVEPSAATLELSHTPWCLYSSDFEGIPYVEYFCNVLMGLERNIGPKGKFQDETGLEELNRSKKQKLHPSVDINQALSKLSNLSKIYFADSA